jgi:hypothetical protein
MIRYMGYIHKVLLLEDIHEDGGSFLAMGGSSCLHDFERAWSVIV